MHCPQSGKCLHVIRQKPELRKVYVIGEKGKGSYSGDKDLIMKLNLYTTKSTEICGVCGETYETDLISYRQKPELLQGDFSNILSAFT